MERTNFYSIISNRIENPVTQVDLSVCGFPGVVLDVKRYLNFDEAALFSTIIVDTCIDMETGDYMPEAYEPAVRGAVLACYADIDLPDDMNTLYAVTMCTDIYAHVIDCIDQTAADELVDAANKRIAFARNLMTSTAGKKVVELLNTIQEVRAENAELAQSLQSDEFKGALERVVAAAERNVENQPSPTPARRPRKKVKTGE